MANKIVLFIVLTTMITFSVSAQENNRAQWPEFNEWFLWKMQTDLNEKQKNVIEYLKKSSSIFNRAFETKTTTAESVYGYSNPEKAIKIVRQAIGELKKMYYPKECRNYRNLTIKLMKQIIPYQQLRLKYKEGTEKFDKMHRKLQLSEIKNGLDEKRFSEYFDCMEKVGLFDNIEKEIQEIKGSKEKTPPELPRLSSHSSNSADITPNSE